MQEIMIDIINQYGYLGVFMLIMIENAFPPIPSEVILTFGGFLTTYTAMNVWGVILAATGGSVVGAILLYTVGRILNAERLGRLLDGRFGRLLHLRNEDVHKAEKWFLGKGNQAVFFCRFVPIVRSLISIPAGFAKMNPGTFLALTAAGSLIWNGVLIYLGRAAGAAWEMIAHYVDVYAMIAAVVLAAAAVAAGFLFFRKRFIK